MDITLELEELKKALTLVKPAIPKKPSHPILGHVLIEVREKEISIKGFDLRLGIQTVCPAEISETELASFTLPAQLLTDIVGKLPKGDVVVLSVDKQEDTDINVCLKSNDGGKFRLRGMDGKEYPGFPSISEDNSVSLDAKRLAEGVQYTAFAASVEEAKQVLQGIRLSLSPNGLEFAATNGHRLAVLRCLDQSSDQEAGLTIPAAALQQVKRALGSGSAGESCTIAFDDTQARIETNDTTISTRLLDGNYPDYSQLLPKEFTGVAHFDKSSFLRKLDAVSLFSDIIRLEFTDSVSISADGKDLGDAQEPVSAEIDNNTEDSRIGFSNKYLTSMRGFPGESLTMKFNGATSPVVFSPELEEGVELTYLVMPVQIRE